MKIKKIKKIKLDTPEQFYDVINANPYNNFLIKTNTSYIGSHNCFVDEINFSATTNDIEKQKTAALDLITSASNRMQSRFMKGTKNPTVLFICSSKRDEQSFLETFIEDKKKNNSATTLIIDEPQWVIRTDKDSPIKFKVALGSKFLENEIVPLDVTEEGLQEYLNKGYELLDVPMGYYESFQDDLNKALMEIAGKSTSGICRYLSGPRIAKVRNKLVKNAFTMDIIKVGNAPNDTAQYSDFFDLSKVDKSLMSKPMFIHLDMSISGDKTGIAGVWIKGKKPHVEGFPDSKELYYQLAFCVSVAAPKGYQISFEKTRQFIYWLREQGFNIAGITADTFQSAPVLQALTSQGFNTKILSVDRISTESKICEPYHYFQSAIYDERIILPYECELLTKELIGLERLPSGKIDHSANGINSKDSADAVCGAVYNASTHAEEFAIDYGEEIDVFDIVNESNETDRFNQEFEEALKKQISDREEAHFKDFGMGKATPFSGSFVSDGILIW